MSKQVTVGLIQSSVTEDVHDNLRRTEEMIRKAADSGAQIICLQELFNAPYFPRQERIDARKFAETIPGPTTNALSAIAAERDIVIIAPIYETTEDGTLYNSAAVIDTNGTLLPTYRKIHIPHDELFYEKNYFAPGDTYRIYETKYAKFAVLICYDQWFPEAARSAALLGADILFYPTAIGNIRGYVSPDGDWRDAWETIQRSHAIANGVHVCAVNRVGVEERLAFWGNSFACDAFGAILQRADDNEAILIVSLNLEMNKQIRDGWGFFDNRRPDTYSEITKPK